MSQSHLLTSSVTNLVHDKLSCNFNHSKLEWETFPDTWTAMIMTGMWETLSSCCQETRELSAGSVDHPVPLLFKQGGAFISVISPLLSLLISCLNPHKVNGSLDGATAGGSQGKEEKKRTRAIVEGGKRSQHWRGRGRGEEWRGEERGEIFIAGSARLTALSLRCSFYFHQQPSFSLPHFADTLSPSLSAFMQPTHVPSLPANWEDRKALKVVRENSYWTHKYRNNGAWRGEDVLS